jgi:hypothetical protein
MSDRESDIEEYVTKDGKVFLAPQYSIAFDDAPNKEVACPDFVALDLGHKQIVVIEVTAAANVSALLTKVRTRETRWYNPIRQKMLSLGVIGASWPIRFLGFVREPELLRAKNQFASDRDVTFVAIEDATFNWRYTDERIKNGLPGAEAIAAE